MLLSAEPSSASPHSEALGLTVCLPNCLPSSQPRKGLFTAAALWWLYLDIHLMSHVPIGGAFAR